LTIFHSFYIIQSLVGYVVEGISITNEVYTLVSINFTK